MAARIAWIDVIRYTGTTNPAPGRTTTSRDSMTPTSRYGGTRLQTQPQASTKLLLLSFSLGDAAATGESKTLAWHNDPAQRHDRCWAACRCLSGEHCGWQRPHSVPRWKIEDARWEKCSICGTLG